MHCLFPFLLLQIPQFFWFFFYRPVFSVYIFIHLWILSSGGGGGRGGDPFETEDRNILDTKEKRQLKKINRGHRVGKKNI